MFEFHLLETLIAFAYIPVMFLIGLFLYWGIILLAKGLEKEDNIICSCHRNLPYCDDTCLRRLDGQ